MMPEQSQTDEQLDSTEPSAASVDRAIPVVGVEEDAALSQLRDGDVTPDAIEQLSQNAALMKSRKVRLALAAHPRTPRRIALRLIRELYTFELMRFAMIPAAAADLKRVADEMLLSRLSSITLGERISLARRSSGTVAGALLLDKEASVWQTALENPRVTEISIVKALLREQATRPFVEAICGHSKWSVRREVQIALLRNAHTPPAKAQEFARRLPPGQLRDILHASRLPDAVKSHLTGNTNS